MESPKLNNRNRVDPSNIDPRTGRLIGEGANGRYFDDGENLQRVNQTGNGSDKPKSLRARAEQ